MHIASQRAHRELYYANRFLSEKQPEKCVTIIHDKMDHSKTLSPHFSHKSKHMDSFMKLPISVTGMIAHGHGDIRYAHYGLDIFPSDSNHTVGSIAKLLRDLKLPPKHSSRELFSGSRTAPLFTALLAGAEMCTSSGAEEVLAKPLPPVLNLQLDNATGDNKNRFVFAFCSLLTYHGVFQEVYINFLIVGHTHDDIDALFGRWSYKLRGIDYPTLPLLMKSFMDTESRLVIPHLIEEVPDFKKFVEGYVCTGRDALAGHTNAQQFKFYRNGNGWPLMQYKLLCTNNQWLPKEGGGIRLWKEIEDGSPKVPRGDPKALKPQKMRGHDEVYKGLGGFLNLWSAMANDNFSREFRRKNEPVSQYWRGVKAALDLLLPIEECLKDGFWPRTKFIPEAQQFQEDGTLCEEFARDAPHVGRRGDRPMESFRVARDVYAGYFLAIRPANIGTSHPFWIARELTDPNSDSNHPNCIWMQYWTPASTHYVDAETYEGWDSTGGNIWREDRKFDPIWTHTDCIMGAWHSRIREGTMNPRMRIPMLQIANIKASVERFEAEGGGESPSIRSE